MGVQLQLTVQILWIVLVVPWEPLTLWVVSLALLNDSHHWTIIKWFSIMFNFNTSIHMLEFVLWSGGVGAQDPGLQSQKSRLQWVMSHSWLYTWFLRRMAAPMPWIYFIWSLHLDGYVHVEDPFTWSFFWWIAATIPWIHVFSSEISVMYMYLCSICKSPDSSIWFLARTCKAFHPSLMFGLHTLGGICYTVICHCPCNPHLAHSRVISMTNYKYHALKIPSLHPLPWRQHSLCWPFPEQTTKNTYFCLGAGSQLCPRANEEN